MKLLKKFLLALLLVFVAIQFIRPEKNMAQGEHTIVFITETNPPEGVKTVLQQSCYDCHSNNSVYPWYNNVAPISFWLSNHIRHGKEHLNFSEWNSLSDQEKDHKLEEVEEMVLQGEMPLNKYAWMHEEARLTDEQRIEIVEWVRKTKLLYQLGRRPE